MLVRVTCKIESGFWRAKRHWPKGTTVADVDEQELEALRRESCLSVSPAMPGDKANVTPTPKATIAREEHEAKVAALEAELGRVRARLDVTEHKLLEAQSKLADRGDNAKVAALEAERDALRAKLEGSGKELASAAKLLAEAKAEIEQLTAPPKGAKPKGEGEKKPDAPKG